jgi:hypothetical protein
MQALALRRGLTLSALVRGLILSAIRQELERDSVVGLRIHRDMTRGTSQSDASGSRLSRDLVLAMVVWRQTPIFAHPAEKRTIQLSHRLA